MLRIAVLLMLRASGADSGAALQPTEVLNGELPRWMRFSGEYRSRFEDQEHMLWRPGNSDRYLLSRLRLGLALQPAPWLVFFGQAQDSRIFIARRSPNQPPYQDSLDLRQAYAQLGDGVKFPLQLRVGRQEFSYGEERLVGLSNWHNIGRSFNAVKLTVTAKKFGGLKMDVFAASVVATREARWDTSVPGDNLHGAYALFDKLWSGGTVEPYFYWRLSPSVATETGGQAKMNTGSLGLRLTRKLTPKWYASSDTVLQRGSRGLDRVSAWAGYWRVRRSLSEKGWKPTLTGDINLSSGDTNPRDGRYQTIDVLYPTPHDKYGLADQVGWKNIRHLGSILEVAPRKGWTVQGKFHSWWLASPTDGLYAPNGSLQVRDVTGRSGRHVGEEADFQFFWIPVKGTQLGGGIGRIFNGEFLKSTTPGKTYTFYYLSLTRVL